MKRFISTIFSLLCLSQLVFAQGMIDVKVDYSVPGLMVREEQVPNSYSEPGIVKYNVIVNDFGRVVEAKIDSTATTVSNEEQLFACEKAANLTRLEARYDSRDNVEGTITYTFRSLSSAQVDSLHTKMLATLISNTEEISVSATKPYYVLYPTENMWNFIELDTVSGMLWQVQFSVDKDSQKYRFKTILNLNDKRAGTPYPDAVIPGRFVLHKTQNMYNFILLDTISGKTWQVQWSTELKNRFVVPID